MPEPLGQDRAYRADRLAATKVGEGAPTKCYRDLVGFQRQFRASIPGLSMVNPEIPNALMQLRARKRPLSGFFTTHPRLRSIEDSLLVSTLFGSNINMSRTVLSFFYVRLETGFICKRYGT